MSENSLKQAFEVNKSELKTYIHKAIRQYDPDLISNFTKKRLNETYIYMQGYIDALKESTLEPINEREMRLFLLERAFDYIKRYL